MRTGTPLPVADEIDRSRGDLVEFRLCLRAVKVKLAAPLLAILLTDIMRSCGVSGSRPPHIRFGFEIAGRLQSIRLCPPQIVGLLGKALFQIEVVCFGFS